jgi:endonuclease-3
MKKADVFEFYRRLAENDPAPETELNYVNPYTLLVAVALSAQATDVGVNKATGPLFATVTTPQQMLELGEDGLKRHIKTIGLFNTKARNVIAAAQILVDKYGGEVPRSREALEELPGVGRKTANVVMKRRLRRGDDRGRHPHLPRLQPHRPRPGKNVLEGRAQAGEGDT